MRDLLSKYISAFSGGCNYLRRISGRENPSDRVNRMCRTLQDYGITPDSKSFTGYLKILCQSGLFDLAKKLIREDYLNRYLKEVPSLREMISYTIWKGGWEIMRTGTEDNLKIAIRSHANISNSVRINGDTQEMLMNPLVRHAKRLGLEEFVDQLFPHACANSTYPLHEQGDPTSNFHSTR